MTLRNFVYLFFLLLNLTSPLIFTNTCFSLSSFEDLGPHGTGRHMDHMLPEIPRQDFRKGAQVKNC